MSESGLVCVYLSDTVTCSLRRNQRYLSSLLLLQNSTLKRAIDIKQKIVPEFMCHATFRATSAGRC